MNSSNITNAFRIPETTPADWFKIKIWAAVFVPAYFLGFGGLLLFFLTIVTFERHRNGAGFIILNLTFVQMVFILAQVAWVIDTCQAWLQIDTHLMDCKAVNLCFGTLMETESWLQVALALNRAVAIIFPQWYRQFRSNAALTFQIIFCWCIGLACEMPLAFNIGGFFPPKFWPMNTCLSIPYPGVSFMLMTSFGVMIPVAITGLIYVVVHFYIKMACGAINRANPQRVSDKTWQRRRQMTRILCASYLGYFLLIVPSITLLNLAPVIAVDTDGSLVLLTALALDSVTFSFNPLFFFVLNKDYRESARILLYETKWQCSLQVGVPQHNQRVHPARPSTNDDS